MKTISPSLAFRLLRFVRRLRKSRRVVVYFHGGGFRDAFDDNHVQISRWVGRCLHARVLVCEYPLGVDADCVRVAAAEQVRLASARGPVVVAGDSAGANLALYVAQTSPDKVCGVVLLCPWLDLTLSAVSRQRDAVLDCRELKNMATPFIGDRELNDPVVSPLFGPHCQQPVFVATGGEDLLAPDGQRYVAQHPTTATGIHRRRGFHDFMAAWWSVDALAVWVALRRWGRQEL
ncbi:alpha/beta hydrolase fold domain-containing protein [Corynebacterium aquilae]|uniref:alpha/beta hydrolase fold domain-containing protein n=1 Tax=Corynebacterium aquilae TaxID=203263 RepID=UPI00095171FD|nr:alpha/beta hydrolase fold domain-containing protein [Corynebacterium aquilae]